MDNTLPALGLLCTCMYIGKMLPRVYMMCLTRKFQLKIFIERCTVLIFPYDASQFQRTVSTNSSTGMRNASDNIMIRFSNSRGITNGIETPIMYYVQKYC